MARVGSIRKGASLQQANSRIIPLACVLTLCVPLFVMGYKERPPNLKNYSVQKKVIQNIDIPQEVKIKFVAPPSIARPAMPVESDDANVSEDATIMSTNIEDAFNIPDLPAPEVTTEGFDSVPFVAYDSPPQVLTMVNPNYPELARRAGIECDVYVEAVINTAGKVDMVRVAKSTCGQTGCDEEALKAVKQWTFTPAKQRDTPVRVRYMVPVRFRLKQ